MSTHTHTLARSRTYACITGLKYTRIPSRGYTGFFFFFESTIFGAHEFIRRRVFWIHPSLLLCPFVPDSLPIAPRARWFIPSHLLAAVPFFRTWGSYGKETYATRTRTYVHSTTTTTTIICIWRNNQISRRAIVAKRFVRWRIVIRRYTTAGGI